MIFLEILILIYFIYVVLYTFVFSLAGSLRSNPTPQIKSPDYKIAVLIPAYQEDSVIIDTAREALQQDYPSDQYEVIVIADSLRTHTLKALYQLPLQVIEVGFEQSTKVKALNHALAQIDEDFELILILDADNVMEKDFLAKISRTHHAGFHAIQGRRIAKNRNTSFALLDGLSEILNNHIYREGSCSLGLSSSLIGSGMAFEAGLVRPLLAGMDSVGGFDRELEILILQSGHKVCYINDAWVYDEKVENAAVFAGQRRRWISSQYFYLRKYGKLGFQALLRGNGALFNSALLRNIQLPRVINLGLLTGISLLSLIFKGWLFIFTGIWSGLWLLFAFSLWIAIPRSFYTREFFTALKSLPKAFWIMFTLLFKLKGANKSFIHTPHKQKDTE